MGVEWRQKRGPLGRSRSGLPSTVGKLGLRHPTPACTRKGRSGHKRGEWQRTATESGPRARVRDPMAYQNIPKLTFGGGLNTENNLSRELDAILAYSSYLRMGPRRSLRKLAGAKCDEPRRICRRLTPSGAGQRAAVGQLGPRSTTPAQQTLMWSRC